MYVHKSLFLQLNTVKVSKILIKKGKKKWVESQGAQKMKLL